MAIDPEAHRRLLKTVNEGRRVEDLEAFRQAELDAEQLSPSVGMNDHTEQRQRRVERHDGSQVRISEAVVRSRDGDPRYLGLALRALVELRPSWRIAGVASKLVVFSSTTFEGGWKTPLSTSLIQMAKFPDPLPRDRISRPSIATPVG